MADTLVKQEPYIKPDPETQGASPAALSEEDIYEDAGDLEFETDPKYQSLYLARVPKFLWEAWSKLDDDAEIQIGTVRRIVHTEKDGTQMESLHMLLSSSLAQHQTVPKEYDLNITEAKVRNTYVFTERDLPGFKSKAKQKFDPASANMPARLTRQKNDKPFLKKPYDPNKRFEPYYKKAIPKRTTLSGKIGHEVNCVAVDNAESAHLIGIRTLEGMRPKKFTKFLNEDLSTAGKGYILPGTIGAQNQFSNFIKTNNPASGQRPQMQKTARMPENELMDRIFECFNEYNYWSMKAFRARLQQPEVYIRETLEKVAVLAKSGRFATQWSLKPENKIANYDAIGDAVAPTAEGDPGGNESDMADEEDGEDDDDVKFEDVVS